MRRLALSAALLACSAAAGAANFADCILSKMPDAQNDAAALATFRVCASDHPGRYFEIAKGSGRGWFGIQTVDQCIVKKAADIKLPRAATFTANACRCLYGDPGFANEACEPRAGSATAGPNPFDKFAPLTPFEGKLDQQ